MMPAEWSSFCRWRTIVARTRCPASAPRSGQIDAFIYDKPPLAWGLRQKYSYSVLDLVFEPQEYAFVLPSDSALRKPLSVAILDAIQSDAWTEMKIRYLGAAAANSP